MTGKQDTDLKMTDRKSMESDSAFTVIPHPAHAGTNASSITTDSTFMQNQIANQRNPSTPLPSQPIPMSVRGSNALNLNQSAATSEATHSATGRRESVSRDHGNSGASDSEGVSQGVALAKSLSERSTRYVTSVHAVGSFPLGSLRIYSPEDTTRSSRHELEDYLQSGDILIVRDVSIGSFIACDDNIAIMSAAKRCEGFKDISPGMHLFWGGSNTNSIRNGYWFMVSKKASDGPCEVHVKRWNRYDELLEDEASQAEARIQRDNIADIYNELRLYGDLSHVPKTALDASALHANVPTLWQSLTSSIKGALLTQILGGEWNEWHVSSAHDYQPARGSAIDPRTNDLNFVFPPGSRTFSEFSIGRDRTEQALDTTSHIVSVIVSNCAHEDSDLIVGELQFAFMTGLLLGNLACQEHWAHIVKVVFRAFRLALEFPLLVKKIITAFHAQLIFDSRGVEGSIFDQANNLIEELKIILTTYKSRLNEQLLAQGNKLSDDQSSVGKAFEELETWLWSLGWDLRGNYVRSGRIQLEDGEFIDAELKDFEAEDERGEYAPQIVELDDEGRERGIIQLPEERKESFKIEFFSTLEVLVGLLPQVFPKKVH